MNENTYWRHLILNKLTMGKLVKINVYKKMTHVWHFYVLWFIIHWILMIVEVPLWKMQLKKKRCHFFPERQPMKASRKKKIALSLFIFSMQFTYWLLVWILHSNNINMKHLGHGFLRLNYIELNYFKLD